MEWQHESDKRNLVTASRYKSLKRRTRLKEASSQEEKAQAKDRRVVKTARRDQSDLVGNESGTSRAGGTARGNKSSRGNL